MAKIRLLTHIDEEDLHRFATGYVADSKYVVCYADVQATVSFNLVLTQLATPYVGSPSTFDQETLEFYERSAQTGWSFGPYDAGTCIGVVIAGLQIWNKTVMVVGVSRGRGVSAAGHRPPTDGSSAGAGAASRHAQRGMRNAEHKHGRNQGISAAGISDGGGRHIALFKRRPSGQRSGCVHEAQAVADCRKRQGPNVQSSLTI
jgi:hypothetical protein